MSSPISPCSWRLRYINYTFCSGSTWNGHFTWIAACCQKWEQGHRRTLLKGVHWGLLPTNECWAITKTQLKLKIMFSICPALSGTLERAQKILRNQKPRSKKFGSAHAPRSPRGWRAWGTSTKIAFGCLSLGITQSHLDGSQSKFLADIVQLMVQKRYRSFFRGCAVWKVQAWTSAKSANLR